jgi:hypothetical protein
MNLCGTRPTAILSLGVSIWVNDPPNLSQNYRLFDVHAAKLKTPRRTTGFAKPKNQKALRYVKDFTYLNPQTRDTCSIGAVRKVALYAQGAALCCTVR